jgi:hypothetical protein
MRPTRYRLRQPRVPELCLSGYPLIDTTSGVVVCMLWHQLHVPLYASASLAQSVERKTLNLVVVGSSPTGGAFCILNVVN